MSKEQYIDKVTVETSLANAKLRVFAGATMIMAGMGALCVAGASVGESFSRGDKIGAAVKTAIALGGMYTTFKGSAKILDGSLEARDAKHELEVIKKQKAKRTTTSYEI